MSLGATIAWTIFTNHAEVWISRPTLVCFMVVTDIILSLSAMFELFLTSSVLGVSAVLGVLPHKCKGTRKYVHKLPSIPLVLEMARVRKCNAT